MRTEPCAVDGGNACAILDEGERRFAATSYAQAIRAIVGNHSAPTESGRNSACFRVRLDSGNGGGETEHVAVKVPRPGPQRTNADATFAAEAAILARLPDAGIANAPRLLARVVADGGHFLFTTWLAGVHPDPATQPLAERHLASILASCTAMDCRGLMHYDLKADNLLVDGEAVGFVDFEFARFDTLLDAFAPERGAWCDDYNVSANPHFPARTNVANFEFRTLYRYCESLAVAHSMRASRAFYRGYLRQRAGHHARMAAFYRELERTAAGAMAIRSGIDAGEAQRRLRLAAAHESMLARLLRSRRPEVVALEWSLAALRHDVFESGGALALARARRLVTRLRRGGGSAGEPPLGHVDATAATIESIARSGR